MARPFPQFQSRSGFLLSCDDRHPPSGVLFQSCSRPVSIPFWVSTSVRNAIGRTSRGGSVSILFWVSTVLRPPGRFGLPTSLTEEMFQSLFWVSTVPTGCDRDGRRFNPAPSWWCTRNPVFQSVLGFYCPATPKADETDDGSEFQSCSGFLLSCDMSDEELEGFYWRPVSILFWVSTVLRPSIDLSSVRRSVSILFWVSTVPATRLGKDRTQLTKVSILFWVSTVLRHRDKCLPIVGTFSILQLPVLGFYCPCQRPGARLD